MTDATTENFEQLPSALQELFRAGAALLAFDYTAEQWAKIAKSLQPLQTEAEALKRAHYRLAQAARSFFLETLNGPGHKQQNKWKLQHWTKARGLAAALMSEFYWLARDDVGNGPPSPSGEERKPYRDELLALMKISVMAQSRVVDLGGRTDDGFPKASPKSYYQSAVLGVWTELGGKLKISRHPITGKIKGPLARFFSAVTEPVYDGSPESLQAIVKRHIAREAALEKWRLEMFIANNAMG